MQKTQASATELPAKHVQRVFTRLTSIYGRRFTSLFKDQKALESAAKEWSQALGGLHQNQIANALTACQQLTDWNPSIPEFIRLACNLPTIDQVVARVLRGDNADPVSYRVRAKIGTFGFWNYTTDTLIKLIRGHYQDCYKEALEATMGKAVVEVHQKALPEESTEMPPRADDDVAAAGIAGMRSSLTAA